MARRLVGCSPGLAFAPYWRSCWQNRLRLWHTRQIFLRQNLRKRRRRNQNRHKHPAMSFPQRSNRFYRTSPSTEPTEDITTATECLSHFKPNATRTCISSIISSTAAVCCCFPTPRTERVWLRPSSKSPCLRPATSSAFVCGLPSVTKRCRSWPHFRRSASGIRSPRPTVAHRD